MNNVRRWQCGYNARGGNSIERQFEKVVNGPEGHQDSESLPNRKKSSQKNEI